MFHIQEENLIKVIHDLIKLADYVDNIKQIPEREKLLIRTELYNFREYLLQSIKENNMLNWNKVVEKGLKGMIPALLALLVAQTPAIIGVLVSIIPEQIAQMTVAGLVAFIINALANWLKHRK